jgi:hypothetical protein
MATLILMLTNNSDEPETISQGDLIDIGGVTDFC